MSDADDTWVNPTAARDGANRLTAAGETLANRWARITGTITALNGSAPWGTDQPGREFNKQYLDGGDEAPAAVTLAAGTNLVERVRQLGPDVAAAVDGTVEVDDTVHGWFGGRS